MVPPDARTPAQDRSYALTVELIDEIRAADTILLGLPVYNFGAPSTIKSWVDHLIAPGLSLDPATKEGLLGGRELIVLASRGGGYAPGTPREGWDHAEQWLPHGLHLTGSGAALHHRRADAGRGRPRDGRAASRWPPRASPPPSARSTSCGPQSVVGEARAAA